MMRSRNLQKRYVQEATRRHLRCGGLVGVLLLVLSGCHLPGLCHPEPAPYLPESFNGVTTEENSAQVGIVEFFNGADAVDRSGVGQ